MKEKPGSRISDMFLVVDELSVHRVGRLALAILVLVGMYLVYGVVADLRKAVAQSMGSVLRLAGLCPLLSRFAGWFDTAPPHPLVAIQDKTFNHGAGDSHRGF